MKRWGPFALTLLFGCAQDELVRTDAGADAAQDTFVPTTDASDDGAADAQDDAADAAEVATMDADAAPTCANACRKNVGLCAPLPACGAGVTCQYADPMGNVTTYTTPITPPTCKTPSGSSRPAYDDGPPRTWMDASDGASRAACVFRPTGTSSAAPRPLVLFFHRLRGGADDVYAATSLRTKAIDFDLRGDGSKRGFLLVADQGQNLRSMVGQGDGAAHDFHYRDPAAPSSNPDFRAADRLIDELAQDGSVDPKRIFVMGWGDGGFFAQAYAIARHDAPTPGGRYVAAAAVYAAGDPFQSPTTALSPDCAVYPRLPTQTPLFVIHRSCDVVVPCGPGQWNEWGQIPGYDASSWALTARTTLMDPNVTERLIDEMGVGIANCMGTNQCTRDLGLLQHARWPDGVADGGGHDAELDMLDFLRTHARP